jgi:hypothetical protein
MPADNYGTMAYINGIWVTQCFTQAIDQELVMDATGIDHVATTVRIRFSGLVAKQHVHGFGKMNTSSSGTAVYSQYDMGEILEKVNGLRKPFAFFIDDKVSFSSWPIEDYNNRAQVTSTAARFSGGIAVTADDWYPSIKEGGKVTASVIKIYGESSARVQFEVEYTYVPCEDIGGGSTASYNRVNSSPVMSLRWYVQDDIDGNTWLQTRTFNGTIELLNRNINPHFARYVVMPPLTKGYKRQTINYSESEDGRSLSFSIVDKEMFIQAPFPVTNFNGSWTVTQSTGFGGNTDAIIPTGRISLSLTAGKNVSKRYLLGKMINIANTKLGILDTPGSGNVPVGSTASSRHLGTVVTTMSFSEPMHENSVSCDISVMYPHADNQETIMWKIVDGSWGEREHLYGDSTTGIETWSDWTHEALYDQDDLSYLPDDKKDFQYDPDTSIYEIPPTVSLAGLALCAIQSPCSPNIAFNKKLVVVEPKEEGSDENQQFDKSKDVSGDSEQKTELTKTNDQISQEDVSSPYMEYRITETYKELSDIASGSFSYIEDSTQRRNAGFHRQGRGRAVKDVTFSATRANKRPQIPGPYDYVEKAENGDINIAVSDYVITNNSVTPSASGQQVVYQINGSFRGMMSRGYSKGESIRLATTPTLGDFGENFPHDKTLFSRIPGENLLSFDDPIFNKQVSDEGGGTDPAAGGDGGEPDGAV